MTTESLDRAQIIVVEAEYPSDGDLITVTISATKTIGRTRVLKVLAHLFNSDSEWDDGLPNVRLIAEHREG